MLGGIIQAGRSVVDQNSAAAETSSFINYGAVYDADASFNGVNAADVELVDNFGYIVGSVDMGINAANLLYNAGTMNASSAATSGFIVRDNALGNTGTIYQALTTKSAVDMVTTPNHAGDFIDNSATIAEVFRGAKNAASNAIKFGNGAADLVSKKGWIYGDVHLGSGADDAYSGQSGRISGQIFCGKGRDYIYTDFDPPFVTANAGLGNDYFSAGAGGGLVVAETPAAKASNAVDTVANFQSYNSATGLGTFLHLDAALSGKTNFVAFNGGTLVQMNIGGGNFCYINVLGGGAHAAIPRLQPIV